MNKHIKQAEEGLDLLFPKNTKVDSTSTDVLLLINARALIGLAELQQTANEIAATALVVQVESCTDTDVRKVFRSTALALQSDVAS